MLGLLADDHEQRPVIGLHVVLDQHLHSYVELLSAFGVHLDFSLNWLVD